MIDGQVDEMHRDGRINDEANAKEMTLVLDGLEVRFPNDNKSLNTGILVHNFPWAV